MTTAASHHQVQADRHHWVVQAPERPGPREPSTDYRPGFYREVVNRHPQAHVVLLEPHPSKVIELQHLWRTHPRTHIIQAVWCEEPSCSGEHVLFQTTAPDGEVILAEDAFDASRFDPAGRPEPTMVRCWSMSAIDESARMHLLSLDITVPTQVASVHRAGITRVDEIMLTSLAAPPGTAIDLKFLLTVAGFRPAGRLWGEAGSGTAYRRVSSLMERTAASARHVRVNAGQRLVHVRNQLPIGPNTVPFGRRIKASIAARTVHPRTIDPSFGLSLPAINRARVEEVITRSRSANWEFDIEVDEPRPDDIAHECFAEFGIFPISFSHPGVAPVREPEHVLSPIIPGFPYTFDDHANYLDHYARCTMAITHRKAGWDCFRHVEIGASGAIPLIPDAREIPRYAMAHYPKKSLRKILDQVLNGGTPGRKTREALRQHFTRHQTTEAMARYVLRMSGHEDARNVLFLDQALAHQADYLSALSLIGFKEIMGANCQVMYPVDYLYQSYSGPSDSLYGRGFGYSRLLTEDQRSPLERSALQPQRVRDAVRASDLVVIGSAFRNLPLLRELRGTVAPEQLILLYGEDTPPTQELFHELTSTGAHLFVRPIHA